MSALLMLQFHTNRYKTMKPAIHNQETQELRFRGLMNETYKKVYNLAYRLSGDRSDAEDLTQEAFFRAYRSFDSYEGDKPFENWIFRIVTRLYLDLIRSRKRRVQALSYDAPISNDKTDDQVHLQAQDDNPNPEQALFMRSVSEDLAAALNALKPDQRTLVLLADVEQIGYQDIAEILGIPMGTVRSRLHRAHKKMKSILESRKATQMKPCFGC